MGKSGKKSHHEDVAIKENASGDELVQAIIQTKWMRTSPQDPRLRTDLSGAIGENPLGKQLVRPTYKFAKSVTKINSKVRGPKTYDETINDPIHRNRWQVAIDKEL